LQSMKDINRHTQSTPGQRSLAVKKFVASVKGECGLCLCLELTVLK
jgi:hypothetical protein